MSVSDGLRKFTILHEVTVHIPKSISQITLQYCMARKQSQYTNTTCSLCHIPANVQVYIQTTDNLQYHNRHDMAPWHGHAPHQIDRAELTEAVSGITGITCIKYASPDTEMTKYAGHTRVRALIWSLHGMISLSAVSIQQAVSSQIEIEIS